MLAPEYTFKLCIYGDGGVGKTTLTNRYMTGLYDPNTMITLGANIFVKYIKVDKSKISLQIWDFGGEDQYKHLLPSYSMGSNGAIFMFDTSRKTTLYHMPDWLNTFRCALPSNQREIPIIMVGGKVDLTEESSVNYEEAKDYKDRYGITEYIECSSKTGKNVKLIFETLTRYMLKNIDAK
ncbi:MAG: GTP-binding protein [Promethearchaeota archaeon]|nr:MAG: GTP-binding protein [Candidatus Lokiarchaeota archaeon]